MANPFPGMNPYLEQPDDWSDFHNQLIASLARALVPQLLPKYRVVTDKVQIHLSQSMEMQQAFIEVKDAATKEVVTAIELLSPANKQGEGRRKYLDKRQMILDSRTNLVEIDLLRGGDALPLGDFAAESHYRILLSRGSERPSADLYAFDLPQAIPVFLLPLLAGEEEPTVDLQRLVNELHEQLGYNYFLDYSQPPPLPWQEQDVRQILDGDGETPGV